MKCGFLALRGGPDRTQMETPREPCGGRGRHWASPGAAEAGEEKKALERDDLTPGDGRPPLPEVLGFSSGLGEHPPVC